MFHLDLSGAYGYDCFHESPACPRAAYRSMLTGIALSFAGTTGL
jgi:hypothetical protein